MNFRRFLRKGAGLIHNDGLVRWISIDLFRFHLSFQRCYCSFFGGEPNILEPCDDDRYPYCLQYVRLPPFQVPNEHVGEKTRFSRRRQALPWDLQGWVRQFRAQQECPRGLVVWGANILSSVCFDYWVGWKLSTSTRITLPEFNIAPENVPSHKEMSSSNHWFSWSRISVREGKQLDAILSKDCLLVALLGFVWRMCIIDDQQGCQYTVNGSFRSLPRWWETLPAIFAEANFWGKKIWIPKYWHLFAFVSFFCLRMIPLWYITIKPTIWGIFFHFCPTTLSKSKLSFTFLWKVQKFKPTKYRYISAGNLRWSMGHGTWTPNFWNPLYQGVRFTIWYL